MQADGKCRLVGAAPVRTKRPIDGRPQRITVTPNRVYTAAI